MNMTPIDYTLIAVAYLLGSIASAVIVSRLMGLSDPRTMGSGNPGATNVLRYGGKKAAIYTLLGDIVKGLIPVLLAKSFGVTEFVLALVATSAFIGHLFPVFFGFKGGKGVATALGVLLAISWPVGLAVLATWLLMALVFKYSSLSALTASLLAPLYMWFTTGSVDFLIMTMVLSVLLIWRHRSNIRNLLAGKEDRIGASKK